MAMTLAQLQNQLAGLNTYTPESEETLRQRAAAVYDPQYEQDVRSLAENLQLQLNQQERGAVRTGMQRSSYANSALSGLRGAGLKAQEQLAAQREGNIANLLLQLIQGEKDRKADADKQRDNLLLNLYNLSNPQSYNYGGYSKGVTAADATTPATDANTPIISPDSPLNKVPSITALANQLASRSVSKGTSLPTSIAKPRQIKELARY